jgi:hypothetical protein
MDVLCIDLLDKFYLYLFIYAVQTAMVIKKMDETEKNLILMKTCADIPEVWVPKVHLLLTDFVSLLAQTTVRQDFDARFEASGLAKRTALCERLPAFEEARRAWLREHPQDLEFVFKKFRLEGLSDVQSWGVTDCRQFRTMNVLDLGFKLASLQYQPAEAIKNLCRMIDQNNVDLRSVLAGYKDNDVDSMHLRRQLMQLRELIKGEQYRDHADTTKPVSMFLSTLAFELWGWDGFDVLRDVAAVQMTGAHGPRANMINGIYVATGKMHNEQKLFKKTTMDRRQYWLCMIKDRKWVVNETQDVEQNNTKALCCTLKNGQVSPVFGQWQIFNADGDAQWKASPALKCEAIIAADLLWDLDECDVVFRAIPASEIESCLRKARGLYMQTSARHWSVDAEHRDDALLDIVTQLEGVEQALHKMLSAEQALQKTLTAQADTAQQPGECIICWDCPASEILLPCLHVCVCRFCSLSLDKCPVCRQPLVASCNRRTYARRRSHCTKPVFDVTAGMSQQALIKSLLQQMRDLHGRV